MIVFQVNELWSIPIGVGIGIYFLYTLTGASSFAGLAVMLTVMPLNAIFLARNFAKQQVPLPIYILT